jgi:hypothetical protein
MPVCSLMSPIFASVASSKIWIVPGVGADVHQLIAAVDGERGRLLATDGGGCEDQANNDPPIHFFFSSAGKIKSILRQSFCAAAHFAVQSGA